MTAPWGPDSTASDVSMKNIEPVGPGVEGKAPADMIACILLFGGG